MANVLDGARTPPHGLFYMENLKGRADAQAPESRVVAGADERGASCFALEEEKGERWNGSGAARSPLNEARPTL